MKKLLALFVSAWLLGGCAMPQGSGDGDPSVNASFLCDAAPTPRATPTQELGARQTSFTVIGHFPDPATAWQATEELRGLMAELFELRDGSEPLVLEAYDGLEVSSDLLDGLQDLDKSVTRLGQTVFLRAEGKRPLDPRPFISVMDRISAETLVEIPGHQRVMNVEVIWETRDSALDQAIREQIGHYFAMPFELMVIAPWAPGGVTAEQAAMRRDFRSIREFAYDIPPKQRIADAEELLAAAQRGDREGLRRIYAQQEEESIQRLTKRTREFLETHPEIDPEIVAGFLQWSTTFDVPVRYRLAAALGEPMGQLRYTERQNGECCLKTDPLEAYSGLGGLEQVSWVGHGERTAASFIAKDVAVGLPALVDYLCQRGVDGVSYRITDYSAYM